MSSSSSSPLSDGSESFVGAPSSTSSYLPVHKFNGEQSKFTLWKGGIIAAYAANGWSKFLEKTPKWFGGRPRATFSKPRTHDVDEDDDSAAAAADDDEDEQESQSATPAKPADEKKRRLKQRERELEQQRY